MLRHLYDETTYTELFNLIYPVGIIIELATDSNPKDLFGVGEWEQIKDRFILAAGDSYTAGSTGGESTHILTTEEMPSHKHNGVYANSDNNYEFVYGSTNTSVKSNLAPYTASGSGGAFHFMTAFTGSGWAHNNMPPYLTVYIWKRTA